AKDPRNAERIFPYIGGEEVNTSTTHAHHRYVINFGEMTEEEALRWPDLMGIVEAKVKPDRDQLADNPDGRRRRAYWWQWGRDTPALSRAIAGLDRVLANSQVSTRVQFAFLPINMVYAHTLNVFPLPTHAAFALLQSRPHELWARFFGSSLEDRLRYTPSDCFETFPFPPNWQSAPTMEAAGQTYYDFRAALMVRNDQGLTKTYNRFHSPNECDPDIFKLRELHSAMDRAVLDAYGWSDIATDCDFLLDYEIDEATWGDKKKPFRYRWPDAVRDEVLARLLDLNQRRHQEEVVAGLHGKVDKVAPVVAKKPRGPRKARAAKGEASQGTLSLSGRDEEDT
ncbi:MAG: type IIL restriction-modification enzyme MmeI, partial [Myxococcales bacterium]